VNSGCGLVAIGTWAKAWLAKQGEGAAQLIALILFQLICTVFFIYDVSFDLEKNGLVSVFTLEMLPEVAATAGLVVGMLFELRLLMSLRRKQADMAKGLRVAAGALDGLMRGYFDEWALTPAERDVATFTIKGFSIAEIAGMRASAEGTVKTHLNAIYRKAGVAGRAQLVSLLVEDLFRAPLLAQEPARQAAE
jgi:DNA-binding CsgD family transcriptional regulator